MYFGSFCAIVIVIVIVHQNLDQNLVSSTLWDKSTAAVHSMELYIQIIIRPQDFFLTDGAD